MPALTIFDERTQLAAESATKHRVTRGSSRAIRADHVTSPKHVGCDSAAVQRQSAQFPTFAPLLEELEIAGWSSHRHSLSGNFHDWLALADGKVLIVTGQATGCDAADETESALIAQAAWATLRAHAQYIHDAGELLTAAARSLWSAANNASQAAVAVAVLDTIESRATVSFAGDCLAWRVRASNCEQLSLGQPLLGESPDFTYASQTLQLALRERLVLVADCPARRPAKLAASVAASFAQLDSESHRRMMAADAAAIVRSRYEEDATDTQSPVSIVAVRRR